MGIIGHWASCRSFSCIPLVRTLMPSPIGRTKCFKEVQADMTVNRIDSESLLPDCHIAIAATNGRLFFKNFVYFLIILAFWLTTGDDDDDNAPTSSHHFTSSSTTTSPSQQHTVSPSSIHGPPRSMSLFRNQFDIA